MGAVGFAQTGQAGAQVPTITYLEGTATIDGAEARIGDTVPLGAVIVTFPGSLVDIEFNTSNAIRLSEDTTFVFNPRKSPDRERAAEGRAHPRAETDLSRARRAGFLVRTPSAVAGVRGTSFFMKVESPTSTYVCACNGVGAGARRRTAASSRSSWEAITAGLGSRRQAERAAADGGAPSCITRTQTWSGWRRPSATR